MTLTDGIQNFTDYFQHEACLVASLTGKVPGAGLAIYKKILYASLVDGLAGIRYHSEGLGNHARFVRFLREHTAWPTGNLVSSPILRKRLPAKSLLRDHLDSRLAGYSTMLPNALALSALDDPIDVLEKYTQEEERKYLKGAEHFELFYRYRNFIVHEFREPGYAMEIFADGGDSPLYHGYTNSSDWSLLYPVGFFQARAEESIKSIEQWLSSNNVDPYSRVRDSSDWTSR